MAEEVLSEKGTTERRSGLGKLSKYPGEVYFRQRKEPVQRPEEGTHSQIVQSHNVTGVVRNDQEEEW